LGTALSPNAFLLAVWRFAQGVGVGAASVLSPMYIAEIAPASVRGRLVSANQLSIVLGVLLATIVSDSFGDPDHIESWRWMFAAAVVPSVIFFCALFIIPESPRWLVKVNNNTTAQKVLRKIGNAHFAEREWNEINASSRQSDRQGTYRELFSAVF